MKIVSSSILIVLMLSSGIVGPLSFNSNISSEAYAEISEEDIQDIGSYVIFGFEEVELKKDVTIISGSVGVNDAESEVKIDKGTIFDDPNSALVGDSIKIEKNSIIQNVFYNELENKGNIVGTQNTPLTVPVIENFPDIPDLLPGTTSVSVDKDETLILTSGQYDDIFVDKGGTLIFEGGSYSATSIETKKEAKILFDDSSEVIVQDEIKFDKETILGPSQTSDIDASDIVIFVVDGDVDFDKNSIISANIFAPNGEIKMDKGAIATGSFIANKVKIDKDSRLTLKTSGDTPMVELTDEYLALIDKLDGVGNNIADTPITPEFIQEIQSDLDRIREIVIELQMNGFDGRGDVSFVDVDGGEKVIGNVIFFDENNEEDILIDLNLPDGAIAILYSFGLIEEFEGTPGEFTLDEKISIINDSLVLYEVLTTFREDIASSLVSAVIDGYHPSTGNTFETTAGIAFAFPMAVCFAAGPCTIILVEAIQVVLSQILDTSFPLITFRGSEFNDLNNNGVKSGPGEVGVGGFQYEILHPAAKIGFSPDTTTSEPDGTYEFRINVPTSITNYRVDQSDRAGWMPNINGDTINFENTPQLNVISMAPEFGNQEIIPGIDILTVNGFSDNLSLLRGNGHGAFEIDDIFSSGGTRPSGVETGDFNNDGIVDIVISNPNSGNLVTFLGDGTGFVQSFTRAIDGTRVDAVGDFNNDGNIDFVLDPGFNDKRIFNGLGTGQIGVGSGSIRDFGISDVAVGDFNNDGNLDLAFVGTSNPDIRLWLGNGAFQFAPVILLDSGGTQPFFIETDDFNNDGTPDIIVYDRFTRSFSILLGSVDGFDTPRVFDTAATVVARDMEIADFNNDGNLDVVTLNAVNTLSDNNSLLFGDGNGNLGPDTLFETGFINSAQSLESADFDSDGDQDIVINSFSSVLIFLNDGDGEFDNPTTFPTGGNGLRQLIVGEFTP